MALLTASYALAQDVLVVEPGTGTLNEAIETHGGDKIYQLKAGEWYQLSAPIENVGYHLQIIGETPVDDGIPATLQTNSASGAVFESMFNAKGHVTLKGLYIMNVDLLGTKGQYLINSSIEGNRVVIDNCVLEPVCNFALLNTLKSNSKTYFTNNKVFNMGHQLSPNDGHLFNIVGEEGVGLDTLYVENNTFVAMGTGMFNGDFTSVKHNYIKFNHNTWVMQKSQIDWSVYEETFIFTNNLMFDFNTQPWATNWQPMPGADPSAPKPALIYADTIPGETLPSSRQQFWEYNLLYRNPGFYTLLDELNEHAAEKGVAPLNFMPFLYPEDSINAEDPNNIPRETILFADDETFPNWKEGNNLYDVDPLFEDAQIYKNSDSLVAWTKPASLIHALFDPADQYPAASTWPQWHWNLDGDITINSTWPLFNGKYTNPDLLKASIEGMPLGDLNWFPDAKEYWLTKKDIIDEHIHSGNESQIDVGYIPTSIKSSNVEDNFKVYPNPVSNTLYFKSIENANIELINIAGQVVKKKAGGNSIDVSDLKEGIYLIKVKENANTYVRTIVVVR